MRERRDVTIQGAVQGVFFRETVRRIASRYDVLAHPPAEARIKNVRSAVVEIKGNLGFTVAPSLRVS